MLEICKHRREIDDNVVGGTQLKSLETEISKFFYYNLMSYVVTYIH